MLGNELQNSEGYGSHTETNISDSNKPPERLYIFGQNALAVIPMKRANVTHHIGDTENDHNRA
jgi:hypothetical protein